MDKSLLKIFGVFLLAIGLLSACKKDTAMNEEPTFDWRASESAPENYPVKVLSGDFIFDDNTTAYIPNGPIVNKGWGIGRSTHAVEPLIKPIPSKMQITWFSYTEDVFYTGIFDLPKSTILEKFQKGFLDPRTNEPTTFNRITAGMAPQGNVSVWISGSGYTVEVARFLAKPADIPWESFFDNPDYTRESYVAEVLTEVLSPETLNLWKDKSLPFDQYPTLGTQIEWMPLTPDPSVSSFFIDFFNGERSFLKSNHPAENRSTRGIPKNLAIRWTNDAGQKKAAKIVMDPTETFAAFQRFHGSNQPFTLEIEKGASTGIDVLLRSTSQIYRFTKATITLQKG